MKSIWDWANPQLRDLKVYEPGKPIEETACELNVDPNHIIKLASNENPLGPSPKAVAAMRAALDNAHLYPDGGAFYLRNAVAKKLGFARENIIIGNGSNEVIEFLGHAFLKTGDDVVISQYAFICYKIIATLFGANIIETPACAYGHDLDAMLSATTPKTRLIFIANPNNPTGTLLDQRQIDRFMARLPENIIAVFDEAYFEFLDQPPDTLRYVREGRNLVVLRTFSKIHGLASLRVGYGIAPRPLIEVLEKTREPFNVNGLAQIGALAALDDQAHQRETKRTVDAGRDFLQEQFAKMRLPFIPSPGNFVMVNVGDGPAIFRTLLAQKVVVRPLQGYGLSEWLRITIGTNEQNEKCIAALKMCLDNKRDHLRHDRRHFDASG
jgi:histidinol-phosphate aminotransferase